MYFVWEPVAWFRLSRFCEAVIDFHFFRKKVNENFLGGQFWGGGGSKRVQMF